jgi:hypothetical protein
MIKYDVNYMFYIYTLYQIGNIPWFSKILCYKCKMKFLKIKV